MRSIWTKIAALVVVGILILAMTAHSVRFTETAVVTRFDRIRTEIPADQAGLIFTAPWPIERVHKFDSRLQTLETEFSQLSTEDQKTITVAAYTTWRIKDARTFFRSVGDQEAANPKIGDLLKNEVSNVLRRHPLSHLVNVDPAQMKFENVEREIRDAIAGDALKTYGIQVVSVGVKRLGVPESNTQEVFERMKADRKKESDRYIAEGDAEARKIRSDAERIAAKIIGRAGQYAKALRSEGNAIAATYYEELEKSERLSTFLKSLDALRTILRTGKSTIVIDSDTVFPFQLLKTEMSRKPAADQKPAQTESKPKSSGETSAPNE